MRKERLNNKGFSLVELIIVIAIMAILIGVMAPNLLRFIERTNVSADTQLADTLRMALITAIADPMTNSAEKNAYITDGAVRVFNDTNFNGTSAGTAFVDAVVETLGVTATNPVAALEGELKSNRTADAGFLIRIAGSNVVVTIRGTDRFGRGNTAQANWITVGQDTALTP